MATRTVWELMRRWTKIHQAYERRWLESHTCENCDYHGEPERWTSYGDKRGSFIVDARRRLAYALVCPECKFYRRIGYTIRKPSAMDAFCNGEPFRPLRGVA